MQENNLAKYIHQFRINRFTLTKLVFKWIIIFSHYVVHCVLSFTLRFVYGKLSCKYALYGIATCIH